MPFDKEKLIYYSKMDKCPLEYTKTYNSPYRYLGYRDIPQLIKKYLQIGTALDYGTGSGYSAKFLDKLGFNVIGVDINKEMLKQARLYQPNLSFYYIKNGIIPIGNSTFDLVFSSLVLLETSSQKEMVNYLLEARRVLKADSSFFIAITGSEHLHNISSKWLDFDANFQENENLASGNLVKLYHYDSHIEFSDYYWTQADYESAFLQAGFKIIEIKSPLGNKTEHYAWKDEIVISPFLILVATPNKSK